jgi:hypothetical protein
MNLFFVLCLSIALLICAFIAGARNHWSISSVFLFSAAVSSLYVISKLFL